MCRRRRWLGIAPVRRYAAHLCRRNRHNPAPGPVVEGCGSSRLHLRDAGSVNGPSSHEIDAVAGDPWRRTLSRCRTRARANPPGPRVDFDDESLLTQFGLKGQLEFVEYEMASRTAEVVRTDIDLGNRSSEMIALVSAVLRHPTIDDRYLQPADVRACPAGCLCAVLQEWCPVRPSLPLRLFTATYSPFPESSQRQLRGLDSCPLSSDVTQEMGRVFQAE